MPAKPKRSKFRWFGFGALKGIGVWLLVIVILAIPAVWWLVQIPARNAKAFAACGEFSFSSPKHLGLTATSVKAVAAYGLTAKIKNIVELSVGVAPDFESIPLESQMLRLEDAADGNAPALTAEILGPMAPLIAAFSPSSTFRKSGDQTRGQTLEVKSVDLLAILKAEAFLIRADRMRLQQSPDQSSFRITARNTDTMTTLELRQSPNRAHSLHLKLNPTTALQLNSPRGIETDSTFKDCQKVDIALDGEKITLPAMAKVDLKIHWNDLSLEEFSAQSKPLSDDLNDMSLRASGIVDSIIYDNREMSENNLAKILSLSSGKQGLLGLAITALVWIGKQIADRVGKMAMDRLFRGRRRRRKSRVSR